MQLWPGGRLLYVCDGPSGRAYVRSSREESWALPDAKTARDVEVNRLALKYQQAEIYFCDSSLVSDLLAWGDSNDRGGEQGGGIADNFTADMIENLYPDPTDWTMEQCKEWMEEHGVNQPDPEPWHMDTATMIETLGDGDEDERKGIEALGLDDEELRRRVLLAMNEETVPGLDVWKDAVRTNAEPAEIFEWWRITEWFADLLIEVGECVLKNSYGQWWGRCTTGQAYIMDGVLQKAAVRHLEKTKS